MTFMDSREEVDLSNRELSSLPEDISDRQHIKYMYLSDNQLLTIPPPLFQACSQIKWLDLRSNHLTFLPPEIGHLKNLNCLLLEDNLLQQLPLELGQCYNLKVLHLAGNPLTFPPFGIVEKGCDAVRKYLLQKLAGLEPEEPLASPPKEPFSKVLIKRTVRTRSKTVSSQSTVSSIQSLKKGIGRQSFAYLDRDDKIKLRIPNLPSSDILLMQAKISRTEQLKKLRNTASWQEYQHIKKLQYDEKWKGQALKDQLLKTRKLHSGEIQEPSLVPPFGDAFHQAVQEIDEKNIEFCRTGILELVNIRSESEIADVREHVHQLMEHMEASKIKGTDNCTPEILLDQATQNLEELRKLSKAMHRRKRTVKD